MQLPRSLLVLSIRKVIDRDRTRLANVLRMSGDDALLVGNTLRLWSDRRAQARRDQLPRHLPHRISWIPLGKNMF